MRKLILGRASYSFYSGSQNALQLQLLFLVRDLGVNLNTLFFVFWWWVRLLPVGWVEVGGVGWWALSRATVCSLSRHGDR